MNSRLTLQDLAGLLAEYTGKDKKATELFLKEFIAVLSQGVYADKVAKVKGLGTFKIISVDQRESIHVNTGERFVIPKHYKFSFLPDKELRELVNKPFSFFETTELNEDVNFLDLDESIDDGKESETEDESVEDLAPEDLAPEEEIRTDVPVSEPESEPEPESELVPEVSHTEEEATSQSVEVRPDPYTKKLMCLMITLILFVLLGIVACLNRDFIRAYLQKDRLEVEKVQSVPVDTDMPVVSDTVETPEDTIAVLPPDLETEQEEKEPVETQEEEVVIDRITIKSGDRLTMIARSYYGHKLFWVYIYEYNKAKIANPNNVPIGTEIEIPAARLYDINAKDRASLDKAAAKQTEILTQSR